MPITYFYFNKFQNNIKHYFMYVIKCLREYLKNGHLFLQILFTRKKIVLGNSAYLKICTRVPVTIFMNLVIYVFSVYALHNIPCHMVVIPNDNLPSYTGETQFHSLYKQVLPKYTQWNTLTSCFFSGTRQHMLI